MKHIKRLFALLLMLCVVSGLGAAAFATDDMCTIRVFSGSQGTVPGGTVSTYQVKRGSTFNAISAVGSYATANNNSKYYPKGLRESGKEESHALSFTVEKDQDFVITYGVKGQQVTYYVRYVDSNGSDLRARSGPFTANAGDRVYVAYVDIDGYRPDAYNRVRTLTEDYTFTFVYTRATAAATTTAAGAGAGAAGVGAGAGAGAANANANAAAGANAAGANAAGANAAGANTAGANVPAANTNPETINIIDEDVPLAGPGADGSGTALIPSVPGVIEPNHNTQIPTWAMILGALVLLVLIAILYWYLLFFRKKRKYANYGNETEIFDDTDNAD